MNITINGVDVTAQVCSFTLSRTNDLSGGLSTISGELTLISNSEDDYRRCHEVVFGWLALTFEIDGFTVQTDGTTILNLVQLTGKYFARQPVYSKKQLASTTPLTRSTLINDVLTDFSVPHSISTFGDKQYDLAGDVDSDPIAFATSMAVASGYLTYVSPNNSGVRFKYYNSFAQEQAVATTNHVMEMAGITPPTLDRVTVVGTTKTESTDTYGKKTIIEESKSVFGSVEERTTTTIDPATGDEESETVCMMKLLRPDTHPKDAQLVIKEQSSKKVYSDSQRRISGYIVEVNRNQAAISQDSKNSILIKAERIEYSANYDKTTSELYSSTETTYQAHTIGRLQLVVFKPGGLESKKVDPPSILSGGDGELTEAQENKQYISPLVLTKRVQTSYTKIGRNSWRERVTISERQFVSKTKKTNGAKNETQEVRLLGGMKTTQNSSRVVDSVPQVQTLPNNETETTDQTNTLTFTGDNVPSVCFNRRTERIELSGVVSAIYLQAAGKLQAIPRLNHRIAYSLIPTAASEQLLVKPYAKLATDTYNLMPVDITLEFKAGSDYQLAGTFLVVSNATRVVEPLAVPPPIIVGTSPALQLPTIVDSTPTYGGAIAKPLHPIGTVSIPTIDEDDNYWYVDEISEPPTVNDVPWLIGTTPVTETPIDEITSDTNATYDYVSDYTIYDYSPDTTAVEETVYENYLAIYTYK